MRKLVLFGMVGVLAQLIDGALGMAYGLTSTTLLVAVGTASAAASATVHLAELGTTAVSGASHWRFAQRRLADGALDDLPGAVGAFLGAVVLSSSAATPPSPGWRASSACSASTCCSASSARPRPGPAGRPLPSGLLAPSAWAGRRRRRRRLGPGGHQARLRPPGAPAR